MTEATLERTSAANEVAQAGGRRWLSAMPGVLYVAAFVAASVVVNTPNDDDSNSKWVNFYADRAHQIQILVSGFLLVFAAMLLMTFLVRLYNRVYAGRAGEDRDPLPLVATATAGTFTAAAAVASASVAGAMIFGSLRVPSADVLRLVGDVSFPMLTVGGGFATALAIGSLTLAARRTGYFGRALVIFSYVAAAAGVASFMFFPLAVPLIWVLVVSVVMARRPALT